MTFLTRFPEIYRYSRSEAGTTRLVTGFLTVNVICLCILLSVSNPVHPLADPWKRFFTIVQGLQIGVLLVYGTLRTIGCVFQERAERTWDFQRLTPLTAFEITLGKFIGAPIFAYFLFVTMLPWTLVATLLSSEIQVGTFFESYRLSMALIFFFMSFGLLVSAHASAFGQGRFMNALGTLVALWGASHLGIVFMVAQHDNTSHSHWLQKLTSFHGVPLTQEAFFVLSFLVFGVWAFAGAQWRIGNDLLEGRCFWRLPAFLIFLSWYILGIPFSEGPTPAHSPYPLIMALVWCSAFVYISAFLWSEKSDYWRRWLSNLRDTRWLDHAPVWVTGYATLLVIAVWLGAASYTGLFWPGGWSRSLVLIPIFLGRDLCFLQWCRCTKSRRPEMMAFVYLVLSYTLPPIVLIPFGAHPAYLYSPLPQEGISFVQNILPGSAQAIGMAVVTFEKLRQQPKPHFVEP